MPFMNFKKIFLLLCIFIPVGSLLAQDNLFARYTTTENRNKVYRNLINNTINKNLIKEILNKIHQQYEFTNTISLKQFLSIVILQQFPHPSQIIP